MLNFQKDTASYNKTTIPEIPGEWLKCTFLLSDVVRGDWIPACEEASHIPSLWEVAVFLEKKI